MKLWVQKSNTTRVDLSIGPQEDQGEKKRKKAEINNSHTRAEKARAYKIIFMLAT